MHFTENVRIRLLLAELGQMHMYAQASITYGGYIVTRRKGQSGENCNSGVWISLNIRSIVT